MKKIFAILISAALSAASVMTVSAAGFQVSCDASAQTVKQGEEIVFTVSVSGAEAAKAAMVETSVPDTFEVVSGEWMKRDALMKDFNGEDGVIAFDKETDLNGSLLKLTLKAVKSADTPQKVAVTVAMKGGTSDLGSASAEKTVTVQPGSSNTTEQKTREISPATGDASAENGGLPTMVYVVTALAALTVVGAGFVVLKKRNA